LGKANSIALLDSIANLLWINKKIGCQSRARCKIDKLRHWNLLAAILMPDHLRAIVAPTDRDARVGNFSAALKRWMRKELSATWKWQPGCFDRLLRPDESLHDKWLYMPGWSNVGKIGLIDSNSMK